MNCTDTLATRSTEIGKQLSQVYCYSRNVWSFTKHTQPAYPWEVVRVVVSWHPPSSRSRRRRPWLETGRRHQREYPNRSMAWLSKVPNVKDENANLMQGQERVDFHDGEVVAE
jgi:hypothetical protein